MFSVSDENVRVFFQGNMVWANVNVGVHSNPSKHKRVFYFDQDAGEVTMKGQGVRLKQLTNIINQNISVLDRSICV